MTENGDGVFVDELRDELSTRGYELIHYDPGTPGRFDAHGLGKHVAPQVPNFRVERRFNAALISAHSREQLFERIDAYEAEHASRGLPASTSPSRAVATSRSDAAASAPARPKPDPEVIDA